MRDRSEGVEMHKIANTTCLRVTHRQSGFTLVEVLVAIFVLVVGLLGVISVATTVINGNAFGKRITVATTLAQDKMEELKGTAYSSIASGSDTQESLYTRTWTVTPDSPAAGMKAIDVSVTFPWKDTPHDVTLKTIVAE
ncbi:MAG: prepilin-type N-terminal cleavage/methylation domain-containing protein [Syntrophaceae bacterium]|nr:prepilin-type N-terminal cleavage/methylation domain-containing protein [Syntrophaceae bacterium]